MAAAQSRTVLPATPAVKSGVATAPTHRGARRETRLDFHGIHARPAGGAPDRPRPACGPFRPGPRRDGAARPAALGGGHGDRTSVVAANRVSVRGDIGVRRNTKNKPT